MKNMNAGQRSPRLVKFIRNHLGKIVLAVSVVIVVLGFLGLDELFRRSNQAVDKAIQARYQTEAQHIVEAAMAMIESTVDGAIGPTLDQDQQGRVKRIIRETKFDGGKGYLYLYDIQGICIAHGEQRGKEGRNLIDQEDEDGVRMIEQLREAAKRGGGFVKYKWPVINQSENVEKQKIGYAKMLRGGTWWIGSGAYLDDIHRTLSLVKNEQDGLILHEKVSFLVALFLLMGGGFWAGMQLTGSMLKVEDMTLTVENMTTLSASVAQERLSLAGRLHDLVSKFELKLNGALAEMVKAQDAETIALLVRKCRDCIKDFDERCQEIENDIYPRDIRLLGLSPVLREFLDGGEGLWQAGEEHQQPSGLTLTHDIEEVPRSINRHEVELYFVARGLIHNVVKHADASRCEVSLSHQEGAITLMISDNGRGFVLKTQLERSVMSKSRFGLQWISATVEGCHGAIKIVSSPGLGTKVCVTMPWPPASENENSDEKGM